MYVHSHFQAFVIVDIIIVKTFLKPYTLEASILAQSRHRPLAAQLMG